MMIIFMLICFRKLELYIFKELCLNEVCVYLEHASVWIMMNEGMSMLGVNVIKRLLCESCAHMYSFTIWMNDRS